MHILIYGANGYLGSHLVRQFVAGGHAVSGLVRSAEGAKQLEAAGGRAILGDLDQREAALKSIATADVVIYAAQLMLDAERDVVGAILDRLRGTGKSFIFTSGTGVLSQRTDGDWSEDTFAEDDPFIPSKYIGARKITEDLVRAAGVAGLRAFVVRPSLIWGNGGCLAVANFYDAYARTGRVAYVGRGLNLYSNVHVDDLAHLYELVLERGTPGALYHAVSGETNFRTIAEGVAEVLGAEAHGVTFAEALEIWDKFTALIGLSICSRSRAPRARRELGWEPHPDRLDIMDEVTHPAFRKRLMDRPAAG